MSIVDFNMHWESVRGRLKEIFCKGGLGILWEHYCLENKVPEDIEKGFLEYLNSIPESWFEADWGKR